MFEAYYIASLISPSEPDKAFPVACPMVSPLMIPDENLENNTNIYHMASSIINVFILPITSLNLTQYFFLCVRVCKRDFSEVFKDILEISPFLDKL